MMPAVGARVRIGRDEDRWPSAGTWPRYRGKVGTIVTINRSDGEFGVRFTRNHSEPTTWFLAHELTVLSEWAEKGSFAGSGSPDPEPAEQPKYEEKRRAKVAAAEKAGSSDENAPVAAPRAGV